MPVIVRQYGDVFIRDMSQPDGRFLRAFPWWWFDNRRHTNEAIWADFGLKVGRYDLFTDRLMCFEPGPGLTLYRAGQWLWLHAYRPFCRWLWRRGLIRIPEGEWFRWSAHFRPFSWLRARG